ncbi:MAG TPA: hypothetical protein VFF52_04530 [Isosphaeraceae bacterium]|nr:hypothetical protein [Isosphaeraceae bacterium]
MAYAEFDLKTAVRSLELSRHEDADLFKNVGPIKPSDILRGLLDEFGPVALGINTQQARREYIIAPILMEAKRRSPVAINVLPGVTLAVDPGRGLSGYCDDLITQSPELDDVESPIVAVVEAKKEDLVAGLGQAVAEMVAIQLFNEKDGTPVPAVYGCVTSGSDWRFLKLQGKDLFIDRREYHLDEVATILGILVSSAQE